MIATSADGVPIAYTVVGAGPPLVLLHGFRETGASWQEAGYVHDRPDTSAALAALHAGAAAVISQANA